MAVVWLSLKRYCRVVFFINKGVFKKTLATARFGCFFVLSVTMLKTVGIRRYNVQDLTYTLPEGKIGRDSAHW